MSEGALRVLLVDDEASLRKPLARYLGNMYEYHVDTAANEEEAWERVLRAERPYDVALIDDLLTPKPGMEPKPIGVKLMTRIRERCPETECIIFTGWGMDRALDALQAGAYRYLAKPLNLDELGMTIRMAAEQARLRRERDLLSATLEISEAMLSELDVGKTLEVITEAVPKLVGAEACAVALLDHATGKVRYDPIIPLGDATVKWHRHLQEVQLTKQITEMGELFVLSDVAAEAKRVDENLRLAGVKSFAGVPIPGEPQNLGVLYAYSTRREAFGTHERRVLQWLAGQAAIALENARLFEAETQRRREAETLRETALALTTTLEQQEIFERILTELQKVVPYDSASVQLLKGDRLEIIGGRGFPNLQSILGHSFPVDGDNPNQEVVRRRDWFIVSDAPAVYGGFSKEPHVQASIRGWLGVPMLVGNRFIGMIALDKRQPGFYTGEHARLAQTFAAQAAVAIENARLYNETQQRARNLVTLQDLALTISSSLDLDETLRKACQAAVEFFNADHSGLALFDPSYVEGKVRAEYPASGTLGTTIPVRGVLAEERLIEAKEPLIISNVASDESLGPVRDILSRFDIRSILIVPVVFKGRVLGSFSLDATGRLRTFTENEVDLCKIFAAQVAVAIENARLFRSIERQAERLGFLYEIGGELTSALEPDSILDAIAGHIVRLVGARKSLFLLVDKERGRLIKASGYGYPPEHLQRLTFEEVEAGVSGWVLRTGKPALVADAQSDPRNIGIALERAKQFGTACLIVAPLVVKGEIIGTLTAVNVAGDPPFTEDDLNMVVMLANQAAIAIENARLYEGERRRAREAEAMVRVGQAISSTLDLDGILETVAKNALPMLGLEDGRSTIFLVDEKTGDFVRLMRVPPRKDGNGPRRSGGLSSLVIETGEPIVIPDVRRDSRVRASVVEEGVRSLIGVPLKVKGRTIGVLFANTLCLCDFTTHDIEMLSSLANQAAVAIENARLFSQLSETKERLNGLIASSLDAVIAIGEDKKITVFNRQAEEMFGWTAKEMEGRSVARLHVDFGKAQEIHEVVNREGTIIGWEIVLKHKDGTRIPALLSATLVRDSQENPIGQAGFIRDLRQVNLLEERLRALMQVSQAITGILELDTVLDLIVASTVAAFPAAQSGTVHLYDERTDTLRIRAISLGYSAEALEALNLRVGEGTAGWVFQNWQPLVVNDTRQEPRYKRVDHPEVQVHRSMICVPLRVRERVIGTLSLNNSDTTGAFQSEDLGLLASFADQAAIAIDNARRMQELEQMRQAAGAMSRVFEPRQALQQIVGSAAQVLQVDSAVIWSYDEVRQSFIPEQLVAVGIPPDELERFREEEPKPGRTAETVMHEGYVTVMDISQPEYDFLGQSTHELLNRIGVQSFQGIMLKLGDERLGVLYANYNRTRTFDKDDEARLRTFASHAALALKNARLVSQMQRTREAAGVIAGVTVQEDLEQTLKTIVQHTQRVLHSDAVTLYSCDEATGQFGEWATEIIDARDPDSARQPEKLDPDSAVGTILRLEGPRYYHLAEDHADQDRLLAGSFVHAEGIEAAIGIQLRAGERQVGVMFVNFRSPHRFTSGEIATIQLFADQAALAIANARFYEGEQRRAREAEALVQVGQAISSTLDLDRILETMAKNALPLLGLEDGKSTIFLVDEKTGDFVRATRVPPRKDGNGPRPSGGLTSLVIETGEPIVIPDVRRDSRVRASVVESGVRSVIGMPLKVKERTIGVLFASTFCPRDFTQRDIEMLSGLANQAAVAIENARLYGKEQQEVEKLALINQIAAEISSSLDLERTLQTLVDELAQVIGVEQCAIAIFDKAGEYADVVAEYLEEGCVPSKGVFRIPLCDNPTIDIVCKTKKPLAVKDAQHDRRMEKAWDIMKQRQTQSIMIVPIVIGDKVIGTIGLDAVSGPRDFTKEEEWLAETIAYHAAIAIQNAWQYEELKHTKGLVGARTALAWMGMTSSAWRHATDKHALTIQEQAQLLRKDLQRCLAHESFARIEERLILIERQARQIPEKPITPPLSVEDGVMLVLVNDLIGERARQLWQNEPYKSAELQLDLRLDKAATVWASPEWLRRAFDVVVDNAVDAVADSDVREITVGTREACRGVEIIVSDTGSGIPEEVQSKLGLEPIENPEDARGLGMGLLMAQTIVQTYGGEIQVDSTGPSGTIMVIWLPREK